MRPAVRSSTRPSRPTPNPMRLLRGRLAVPAIVLALAGCGTAPAAAAPALGGCQMFPDSTEANRGTYADFNRDVSGLPVHANSADYIGTIAGLSSNKFLHPDFGSNASYGIPFRVVPASQAMTRIRFTAYGSQSDPGPYPIPGNTRVEAGSDRHVLVLRQGECKLYELFEARYSKQRRRWDAASGAVFDLGTGRRRPEGWTSADAAGLPIL